MAILDIIGTTVTTGASSQGATLTNYIVQRSTSGEKEVEHEDITDADGATVTRIIFNRHAKLHLELICKTAAAPATDFPEGDMCTVTGLTTYYVDKAPIETYKGAQKVTVDLTAILTNA